MPIPTRAQATTRIDVRSVLPRELVRRVDHWAVDRNVSRSEAITRLVDAALDKLDWEGRDG